jgi:hypothetical protein
MQYTMQWTLFTIDVKFLAFSIFSKIKNRCFLERSCSWQPPMKVNVFNCSVGNSNMQIFHVLGVCVT